MNQLSSALEQQSIKHCNTYALLDKHKALTFAELYQKVQKAASYLLSKGVQPGDTVALLSQNSIELVVAILSAQCIGVRVVVLNCRLTAEILETQIKASNAVLLLVSQETDLVTQTISQNTLESLYEWDITSASQHTKSSDSDALIVFTSGSTGVGKGVRLSLNNLLANIPASNKRTALAPGDTWLVSLPLFHVGGLGIIYRCVYAGACALISPKGNAKTICSFLDQYNISHFSLIPTVLEQILSYETYVKKLKTAKCILLGGAPCTPTLTMVVEEHNLPIMRSYGMTETAAHVCTTQIGSYGSDVGTALGDTAILLEEGGEISLRGASLFKGYLGENARSQQEIFRTGDVGTFDTESNLVVIGRKDRMFISGGENVYPEEIEQAALKFKQVLEAAVISQKCSKWGEKGILFIVLSEDETSEDMQNHLRQILPRYKLPQHIIQLDNMPRLANSKINYQELKAIAQHNS